LPPFESLKSVSRQTEAIKPSELKKLLSDAVKKYEDKIEAAVKDDTLSLPEKAEKYKKIKAGIAKVRADYAKYLASLTIEEDKKTVRNFLDESDRLIKVLDAKIRTLENGIAIVEGMKKRNAHSEETVDGLRSPQIQKEFTEVANAKKTKLETQKHDFKELEEAEQKLKKESEDILRIASRASENPDEFVLKGIEEYAKAENISLLAAKASVLRYVSPEWKEKVDAEAREYFANFDLEKFVKLPKGSQEVETLKILCDEGYLPYLVVLTHYNPPTPEISRKFLGIFDKTMAIARKMAIDTLKGAKADEKEKFILDPDESFPEAIKYIKELKTKIKKEEYERIIDLIFKYIAFAYTAKAVLEDFDCDETTLLLQKFATDEGLEIGNYMKTVGHAVLKIDGLPIVLDTYDLKLRTTQECAQKAGYEGQIEESSFWIDNTGEYVAQYSSPDVYPSKIIRYTKKNRTISEHEELANILKDWGMKYAEMKKDKEFEKAALYKVLEIDPKNATAYRQLADTFKGGDIEKVKKYYREAIKLAPNGANSYSLYADILYETGEVDKAYFFAKRAVEISPNTILYRMGLITMCAQSGEYEEAMREYNKVDGSKIKDIDMKMKFGRLGVLLEEKL